MELAEVIWLLIKSIEGDDNTRVNPTASAGRKITESIPLSCIHGRQHQSTSATKAGERDTAGSVASHASSQGNMLNTTWSMRSAPSEVRMSSAKWNVGIDGGQRTGGSRIGNCGIYHKDTKMCPCSTEFIWISVEFRRHENKNIAKNNQWCECWTMSTVPCKPPKHSDQRLIISLQSRHSAKSIK